MDAKWDRPKSNQLSLQAGFVTGWSRMVAGPVVRCPPMLWPLEAKAHSATPSEANRSLVWPARHTPRPRRHQGGTDRMTSAAMSDVPHPDRGPTTTARAGVRLSQPQPERVNALDLLLMSHRSSAADTAKRERETAQQIQTPQMRIARSGAMSTAEYAQLRL